MEIISKICTYWTRQSEIVKVLIVALIIGTFTYTLTPKSVQLITLSDYQNPNTGEIITPAQCTVGPGENQCRIYKDEFVTEEVYNSTISRKTGSTTCCLTTSAGTLGGEVRPTTQSCWTIPQNLPKCPSGFQKK